MKRSSVALADLLQDTPWFRVLTTDEQARVSADICERWYSAGSVVAHKGEAAQSWIGVADGLLKVSSVLASGKVVMFAGVPSGCWVGEGSVLKREVRRYDVVALRECRVLHLPASTFRALHESSLAFNQMLVGRLNSRLSLYVGMREIDRMSDPVARVARYIATFFDPVPYPHADASVHLAQSELAELAGLSRTTISLALRRLELEGLLTTQYGRILVHDLPALKWYEADEGRQPLRRGAGSPAVAVG
ncbi:Crp/Fnr family transcriptional regulator [Piscinibacter gummiphilus]|uniref:Uncharacterized protein n=1 Tax=Piscinibacter gummiphilus TaxID=946333 RepID=A0A1W6L5M8_9BURK|nr:cyclic nucleotide-binding domain-containing protein [Piscinibacter gummiphilus]ARN19573.1 hypothetical protein A4W93_06400 [Piscinibacter gummiphilus]ATU64241.1 Crp/Fnr family transcriptional regulator [Piscinibacter gummiphilus]GLS98155.1 Crp/Fnr family transcriptional regulator [Piscinibacter gummiphilus]